MPIDPDTLSKIQELSDNIRQLTRDVSQSQISVAQDVARLRLDTAAEIHAFQLVYEQRHATLEARVVVMETSNKNFATREDIVGLRGELRAFAEQMQASSAGIAAALESFETIKDSIAYRKDIAITQTDIAWLKQHFWQGAAVIGSILLVLIGILIQHVMSSGHVP